MSSNKEIVLQELQAITGVVTNDVDYLAFLMLQDGCYFDEIRKNLFGDYPVQSEVDLKLKSEQVPSMEDFFK